MLQMHFENNEAVVEALKTGEATEWCYGAAWRPYSGKTMLWENSPCSNRYRGNSLTWLRTGQAWEELAAFIDGRFWCCFPAASNWFWNIAQFEFSTTNFDYRAADWTGSWTPESRAVGDPVPDQRGILTRPFAARWAWGTTGQAVIRQVANLTAEAGDPTKLK